MFVADVLVSRRGPVLPPHVPEPPLQPDRVLEREPRTQFGSEQRNQNPAAKNVCSADFQGRALDLIWLQTSEPIRGTFTP